ncbi:hypothetical protein BC628DRAFT_1423970 [Trametes gibbosa]|nr:hypothetical protein BC628DRAFT_1423970 [Trametes gibbosa]
MSDPPPKKVSSLRDRIAAFENKGAAPAPQVAPPAPRPKPGHIAWTPKPLSPPTSPKATTTVHDDSAEGRKAAGMSAADAKEAIGKLSLKERMAALQGSGGFGGAAGAATSPPPRPASEKPKWKPPPVVQKVEPIGGDDDEQDQPTQGMEKPDGATVEAKSSATEELAKEVGDDEAKEDEGEPDPQEEERQRRAALAARMARLGGARIGMAPPIFGKKPDVPPKKVHKEEEHEDKKPVDVPSAVESSEVPAVIEPAGETVPAFTVEDEHVGSTDAFAAAKDSATSDTLSPDFTVSSQPLRSPAMPVPQVPKRAAPPRRRAAKSPSPAPPAVAQVMHESPTASLPTDEPAAAAEKDEMPITSEITEAGLHGDREPKLVVGQAERSTEDIVKPEEVAEDVSAETKDDTERPILKRVGEEHIAEPSVTSPSRNVDEHIEGKDQGEEETSTTEEPEYPEASPETEAPLEEPEEEDEASRRKRIADRIAKSGGFNPFGGDMPPPIRRDSAESARSPLALSPSHPLPDRRDSQQEATNVKSPSLLLTSPKLQALERKDSVGSVRADPGSESPAEEAPLDDERAESDYDGAITEEDEDEEQRGRPLGRSAPVYEDAPSEASQDREEAYVETKANATHAEHEAAGQLTSTEANEEHAEDDYRIARERPEGSTGVEDVPAVPHHMTHVPRPLPTLPLADTEEPAEGDVIPPPDTSPPLPLKRQSIPPPPKRQSLPPPPRVLPLPPPVEPSEVDVEEERVASRDPEEAYSRHAHEIGPEHDTEDDEYHPHVYAHEEYQDESDRFRDLTEESKVETRPSPPPRHAVVPIIPSPVQYQEGEEEEEDIEAPPPPPPRRASIQVPLPPTYALQHGDDKDEYEDEYEGLEDEVNDLIPPPPPQRMVGTSSPPVPAAALRRPVPPPIRPPSPDLGEELQEVLNDSDVDPIDPSFYSPKSPGLDRPPIPSPLQAVARAVPPPLPPAQVVSPPPSDASPPRIISPPPPPPPQRVVSPPPPPAWVSSPPARVAPTPAVTSPAPPSAAEHSEAYYAEDEQNSELARRRTIAERMAKLGGIRFGAPPPVPATRRLPPPPEPEQGQDRAQDDTEKSIEGEEAPKEEEEDEFARKQRIAARIAGMGGMRFGMVPGMAPPAPRAPVHRDSEDEAAQAKSPPPKRSAPVPPLPPPLAHTEEHEEESDYQHVSDSERGGYEESELEEVTHSDAEEEAPPPPIPDRGARRVSTGPPPVPQARPLSPPSLASPPLAPRTRPPAPSSFTYPPPPTVRPTPATYESQADFVIVDQDQDIDEAPPPPPRSARPPPRGAPLPPPPPGGDVSDVQGDQPAVLDVDFGGETDLSLSGQWSEDSTNYPPAPPGRPSASSVSSVPAPLSQQTRNAPTAQAPLEHQLTPDDLMAHWGRVGIQIHEVAAALHEKSKKSVVGDGSYLGFVTTVLDQIPNAAQPTPPFESFGYLVYSQSATAVQRRASDIMPGDVLVAHDAKFKGHKGLQSYHQHVGAGQPLLAVIVDFETKKSKVRVFQANQHVGQQSVEAASYRLEDLKSGSVKVLL